MPMDWVSTTTGCFAVSNAVAKTALDLGRFVRDVRESRAELTALSAELHALDGVLDILKDDAASASFPADMALQTPTVVAGSGAVVASLDKFFADCEQPGVDKRERWLAISQTMENLRAALEVYRLTLGLALDLVASTTDESRSKSKDVARILAEIGHLRGRMRQDLVSGDAALTLQTYLNTLHKHAKAVREEPDLSTSSSATNSQDVASPVSKAPDSAVDIKGDDSDADRLQDNGFAHDLNLNLSLDLDLDSIPSRAPTPPPKAAARGSSALGFHDRSSSNGSANVRVSDVPTLKPTDGFRALQEGETLTIASSPAPAITTLASANLLNGPASPKSPTSPTYLSHSGSVSIRSGGGRSSILSGGDGGSGSGSAASASSNGSRFSRFFRTMRSTTSGFAEAQTDDSVRRPATSSSNYGNDAIIGAFGYNTYASTGTTTTITSVAQPSKGNGHVGFLALPTSTATSKKQQHARRFSTSLRTPWAAPVLAPSTITTVTSATAMPKKSSAVASFFTSSKKKGDANNAAGNEPNAVFGVSLRTSIGIAASSARTHHSGGSKTSDTKGGSSRREFPLCIFRCYTYIRGDDGLFTPDIFGGGIPNVVDDDATDIVNWGRVNALRATFSRGPDYGESLDLAAAGYSRHDAAAVILQYLEALPRPLVPDAVVRRWITLSRQATVSGSYAKRLDQCIDFWEEALGGVRGPARSLLKLLLNLWGDVADAADRNDMTAERLASRVMNPLFHFDKAKAADKGGRCQTDYMLSLAFIIRKRSEYSLLLRGGGRKSNAAFVA